MRYRSQRLPVSSFARLVVLVFVFPTAMVMDHEEDVTAFKREVNAGKNSDVKNFASETLPTLLDHLKQAREVAKAVGATAAPKTAY